MLVSWAKNEFFDRGSSIGRLVPNSIDLKDARKENFMEIGLLVGKE